MILGGSLNFEEALPSLCFSSCDCLGSLMSAEPRSSKSHQQDWAESNYIVIYNAIINADIKPSSIVVFSLFNQKQTTSSEYGFSKTGLLLSCWNTFVYLCPFQEHSLRHLTLSISFTWIKTQKITINNFCSWSSIHFTYGFSSVLLSNFCPSPIPPNCHEVSRLHCSYGSFSLEHSAFSLYLAG